MVKKSVSKPVKKVAARPVKKAAKKVAAVEQAPKVESGKKPGRPKGAENKAYENVDAVVTRCPNRNCGSTERSPYSQKRSTDFTFTHMHEGRPYNRITYRSCQCLKCHQHRRDRTFELIEKSDS